MTKEQLFRQIQEKASFLCVGLDPDFDKFPESIKKKRYPLYEFNKKIIDATAPYAVAYKLNLAFYEVWGPQGLIQFRYTVNYIKRNYPFILVIADAKRGDIGNTAKKYAKTFFETYSCDAITLAPYMGKPSFTPFLEYQDKWSIILDHTSEGYEDLQDFHIEETGDLVYEHILKRSLQAGATQHNSMFVVGATAVTAFEFVRKIVPYHFLLVPGVGEQGGSLQEVAKYGLNSYCGLLVNSSRGIIHSSQNEDFAEVASKKAFEMRQQMSDILFKADLLTEE